MKSKRHYISEMPRRIDPLDPELGFKDLNLNRRIASGVLESSNKIQIKQFNNGLVLYRIANKFVLIDPFRVTVVYYLAWKTKFFKYLNTKVVSTVLHWRDRPIPGQIGLTSWVFFDLLLPIEGAIMTDIKHSSPGEAFWVRRIEEALEKNLYVYYLDLLPSDEATNRQLLRIKDSLHLYHLLIPNVDDKTQPWGDTTKFEGRRIIISNKQIITKTD